MVELENDDCLPFLDVYIRRLPELNRSWFTTSIYKKPTFTGLMLKRKSFVPYEYKKSAISSMVYRAIRISSSYSIMHKEFLLFIFFAIQFYCAINN